MRLHFMSDIRSVLFFFCAVHQSAAHQRIKVIAQLMYSGLILHFYSNKQKGKETEEYKKQKIKKYADGG